MIRIGALSLSLLCAGTALAEEENALRGPDVAELQKVPHRILFEAYENDNWDLHIMNADGTGRRNLTNTPDVHELYAQASPDGSKICFLADAQRDGNTVRSVCIMDADGSGRITVAENARQPCWNPQGTRVAFVAQEFKRFRVDDYVSKGLFFYDVIHGGTHAHPNDTIHHLYGLSWADDGEWIVATVHGGMGFGHAILALGIDSQEVLDLGIGGCRPCLSPDGKRITWSRDDHTICVADVAITSREARVSKVRILDRHPKRHLYHPDFSPDGEFVSYSIGPGGRVRANGPGTHTQVAEMVGVRGLWNLYVKPATGEGPRIQLTFDDTLSNKESEWIRKKGSEKRGQDSFSGNRTDPIQTRESGKES
ncbi:MAG: hypothetical protein ACC645_23375, partial [Pirellulales bacterium]